MLIYQTEGVSCAVQRSGIPTLQRVHGVFFTWRFLISRENGTGITAGYTQEQMSRYTSTKCSTFRRRKNITYRPATHATTYSHGSDDGNSFLEYEFAAQVRDGPTERPLQVAACVRQQCRGSVRAFRPLGRVQACTVGVVI